MRDRKLLGGLLAFVAVNAFAGGIYALAGADGVPPIWLEGSPFGSYVIPGLFLMIVVGGGAALAAVSVFARNARAGELARSAGWVLLAWLLAQVVIIGFVSWLQPATAFVAIAIILLA